MKSTKASQVSVHIGPFRLGIKGGTCILDLLTLRVGGGVPISSAEECLDVTRCQQAMLWQGDWTTRDTLQESFVLVSLSTVLWQLSSVPAQLYQSSPYSLVPVYLRRCSRAALAPHSQIDSTSLFECVPIFHQDMRGEEPRRLLKGRGRKFSKGR
jgi:hypothetical protein